MFAEPEPPAEPNDPAPGRTPTAADAVKVIGLIYDRGTVAANRHIARVLGWPLHRLKSAYQEANRLLEPAGLRLVREHGEATILPVGDHICERRALGNLEVHVKGLSISAYQAAYQAHNDVPVLPKMKPFPRLLAIGHLVNVGAVTPGKAAKLSEAATFAHPS